MSVIIDGSNGLTTPGVVNTAGETIATTLSVTGATNLAVSSGNVGIGTASPATKLNLGGSSDQTFQVNGSGTAAFLGTSTSVAQISSNRNPTTGAIYDSGRAVSYINLEAASGNSNIQFYTSSTNNVNPTECMRIDSSGKLLVGTASPILSGLVSALSAATAGSFRISAASSGGIVLDVSRTAATGDMVYFRTNSTDLAGFISCPTSNTTTYNSISDYRLKENVTPMTGALDKIVQLKPVTYKWKSDGSDSQGFIAHELQALVPECVTGEKDAVDANGNPKYQGVDTSFLVATLTAAIQEQQALITQLQADVAALKALSA